MARKRGRDIHGWLVIDKPAGIGSTDVVSLVRRALDARKAGHAGTLDPDATGILAVALGEATKTIPVLDSALKEYDFTVAWGAETDSDDASGAVTGKSSLRPDAAAIAEALAPFRGDIMQVPPAVSAVRVDGARAYDLARAGEQVTLAARPLHVAELELVEAWEDGARLRMVCGRGGYVRAIARDLGRALGCLGHVTTLRRVWSGPFTLAQALPLDRLRDAQAGEIEAALLPLDVALSGLARMRATEAGAARIRNGNPGEVVDHTDYGAQVWAAAPDGTPLCIGRYMGGTVHPERVFNLPAD